MWRPLRYIFLTVVCTSGALLVAFAGQDAGQATAALSQVGAAQPDLVIERLIVDPPIPTPGEAVTITVIVKNVGAAFGWSEFHTALYLDPLQQPPTVTTPSTAANSWFLGLPAGVGLATARACLKLWLGFSATLRPETVRSLF